MTEARSVTGDLYGDDRVRTLFRDLACAGAAPEEVVAALREDVRSYMSDEPARDDITIVAARF